MNKANIKNAGATKIAWGLTSEASPTTRPSDDQIHQFGLVEIVSATQIAKVIMKKYIDSGMKYETGIAIGLRAAIDATKIDCQKLRSLSAINRTRATVARKNTEFIALVHS
jgi:hypothetical protein